MQLTDLSLFLLKRLSINIIKDLLLKSSLKVQNTTVETFQPRLYLRARHLHIPHHIHGMANPVKQSQDLQSVEMQELNIFGNQIIFILFNFWINFG